MFQYIFFGGVLHRHCLDLTPSETINELSGSCTFVWCLPYD